MPELEDVLKEFRSRDPDETVVINEGAVITLIEFADAMAPKVGPFNQTRPVTDYKSMAQLAT